MKLWRIFTNRHPAGVLVLGNVSEKKIKARHDEYVRDKIKAGWKLSEIRYTWCPVYTERLP